MDLLCHYHNVPLVINPEPHNNHLSSDVSYGSHTNTHRLTDCSSHRGSKHLLSVTPGPGINGNLAHMNGFGDTETAEDRDEMLDLNQVRV